MSDGTRTRDVLDHNQVLYQLSYTHHATGRAGCADECTRGPGPSLRLGPQPSALSADTMYFAAIARAVSVSGPGCGTNSASR